MAGTKHFQMQQTRTCQIHKNGPVQGRAHNASNDFNHILYWKLNDNKIKLKTMKLALKHTGKITPENVLHHLMVDLKVSSLNVKRLKNRLFLFCLCAILPAKARKCSFVDSKDPSGNTCGIFFGSCWVSTVA